MDKKRGNQILDVGVKAAQKQLARRPRRRDYPHSYSRLYGWLEDKCFALYEAILLKKKQRVFNMAGEIIITSAEIAELADADMKFEEIRKGGGDNEIPGNKH